MDANADFHVDKNRLVHLYREILLENNNTHDLQEGEQITLHDMEQAHKLLMQKIESGEYNSLSLAKLQ